MNTTSKDPFDTSVVSHPNCGEGKGKTVHPLNGEKWEHSPEEMKRESDRLRLTVLVIVYLLVLLVHFPKFRAIPLQRSHCLNAASEHSNWKACPLKVPRQSKGTNIYFSFGEITSLPRGSPRLQTWVL